MSKKYILIFTKVTKNWLFRQELQSLQTKRIVVNVSGTAYCRRKERFDRGEEAVLRGWRPAMYRSPARDVIIVIGQCRYLPCNFN